MSRKFKVMMGIVLLLGISIIIRYACAQREELQEGKLKKIPNVEKGTSTTGTLKRANNNELEKARVEQKIYEEKLMWEAITQYFPPELKENTQGTEGYPLEVDLDKEIEIGTSADISRLLEAKEKKEKEVVVLYSNWDQEAKVVVLKKIGEKYIKLWQSSMIDGYHGRIEVRDINNDGQKEIIARGCVGAGANESVWIYTWNGAEGNLISPIEKSPYSDRLFSLFGGYGVELKDLDNDKIEEVTVRDRNIGRGLLKTKIYKWNGVNYELWKSEEKGLYE